MITVRRSPKASPSLDPYPFRSDRYEATIADASQM